MAWNTAMNARSMGGREDKMTKAEVVMKNFVVIVGSGYGC